MAQTTQAEPVTQVGSFNQFTRGVDGGHIPPLGGPVADYSGIEIAHRAPEFSLPGIDGRTHRLADYSDADALVIIQFASNCPYTWAWEDRVKAIHADYAGRNVAVVAINSNATTVHHNDSLEGMAERARQHGFEFDYLRDDDQSIARTLGSLRTPEVFVFGRDRKLTYHGLIDDNHDETKVTQRYLRDALDAVLAGEMPVIADTPAAGCYLEWGASSMKLDLSGLKTEIDGAHANGCHFAIAYIDADGNLQLTSDATVQVLGSDQLAIWSPDADGQLPRAVAKNPEVTLVLFRSGPDANYAFRGRARVDASVNAAVHSNLPYSEATLDPDMRGVAVVVDVDSVQGRFQSLGLDSRSGKVTMGR